MRPTDALLDRLADEYVLGTLRGAARRRFERWLQERPALRQRVERMQHELAPLASRLKPAGAPPRTWQRIEERLFGAQAAVQPAPRRGWGWRFAALWATVASVALLTLGGLLLLAPERLVSPETLAVRTQQVPAAYIAVLSDPQGRPALVASAARHATLMDLKVLRPSAAQPGTQWQLWGHTAQGERVALGPIDLANRSRITLAGTAEQTLSKLATLSVTAEPAGTTPAAPTRVALLQGPCVKVW
jgi:anti-sigma-K factor RskA